MGNKLVCMTGEQLAALRALGFEPLAVEDVGEYKDPIGDLAQRHGWIVGQDSGRGPFWWIMGWMTKMQQAGQPTDWSADVADLAQAVGWDAVDNAHGTAVEYLQRTLAARAKQIAALETKLRSVSGWIERVAAGSLRTLKEVKDGK